MFIKSLLFIVSTFAAFVSCAEYDVGDIVDIDDQEQRFTICNGDFYNNDLKLSYLNGELNGGHYFVSWFDISATW